MFHNPECLRTFFALVHLSHSSVWSAAVHSQSGLPPVPIPVSFRCALSGSVCYSLHAACFFLYQRSLRWPVHVTISAMEAQTLVLPRPGVSAPSYQHRHWLNVDGWHFLGFLKPSVTEEPLPNQYLHNELDSSPPPHIRAPLMGKSWLQSGEGLCLIPQPRTLPRPQLTASSWSYTCCLYDDKILIF